MGNIAISVIVPVYNVEKYLNRCIDSILGQTFRDFELILVDDGSLDNSGKICDEYAQKDCRIKVIHKPNGGVSSARNVGIDIATGKYIMFVDSDDYIDLDMFEKMYQSSNDCDIVMSCFKDINIEGKTIGTYHFNDFENISRAVFIREHIECAIKNQITAGPYNKLYKAYIIKQYNIRFDENISICEDGLFVFQFLDKCESFSGINKAFYNYVHYLSENLMNKYNENAIEACEKRYLAKALFLKEYLDSKQMFEYVESTTAMQFVSFYLRTYINSPLTNREKRLKSKEAWKNKSFSYLMKKCRNVDKRTRMLYYCHTLRLDWLLHIVLLIKFRKNSKA